MAFALKIAKGAGTGREFLFGDDKDEVRLGRTPENDVIVRDGGTSRNHARIFLKEGAYFLEDLQSSNGTRHNGILVSRPRPLKDGDTVTVGDLTFAFELREAAVAPLESQADPTRELPAKPARSNPTHDTAAETRAAVPEKTPDPADGSEEALDPAAGDQEEGLDDPVDPGGAADNEEVRTRRLSPEERKAALALRARAQAPVRARPEKSATPARARPEPRAVRPARDSGEFTAADLARERRAARRSGFLAELVLGFRHLSKVARISVVMLGAAVVLGAAAAVAYHLLPAAGPNRDPANEPSKLSYKPLRDSFGLGPSVAWAHGDLKTFSFHLMTATRAVAVLHYSAADVSQGEVVISLNGQDIGQVPADTVDAEQREIELVLPLAQLQLRAENKVTFDNARNPPGEEPWRIWNLRVEVFALPELPPDQLLRQAELDVKRARELYELRDVGADNLFKAWKGYRNAWLTLEGVSPKPELYDFVRARLREVSPQLEQRCSRLMLEAKRQLELRHYKQARDSLEEVRNYFPTIEHRCHTLALEKLEEYQL